MGFNTVAVLYNDMTHQIRDDGPLGGRIARAMMSFTWGEARRDVHFGAGMIVSQAHADYTQIVAVGQNRGRRLDECNDLDWMALDTLAECLRRHGWTVKKPSKRRKPASAHREYVGSKA